MAVDQTCEEIPHISAERAHAIAALLHHERRVALLAEHMAELLEVACPIGPGTGRIASSRIETGRHHEEGRRESANAAKRFRDRVPVLLRRDVLRLRQIEIVAGAWADPGLVTEPGEIRIGEARM